MKPGPNENSKAKVYRRSPLDPFVLIPKVFYTRFDPTWKAILVYSALVYYSSNNTATCEYVTIKTMAKRVGIGWQTFIRGLEELKRKGLVEVKHRSAKSSTGGRIPQANLYELADLGVDSKDPI